MGRFTDLPLRRSAALGALAFVVGYAVTYAGWRGSATSILSRITVTTTWGAEKTIAGYLPPDLATWKAVGWLFYGGHFSRLQVPNPGAGTYTLVGVVPGVGGGAWVVALVPLICVGLAGALAVYLTDSPSPLGAKLTAASVSVGYLLPATLGGFLFFARGPAGVIAADLLWSIGLVGIVYPLVVATVTGTVANFLLNGRSTPVRRRTRTAD